MKQTSGFESLIDALKQSGFDMGAGFGGPAGASGEGGASSSSGMFRPCAIRLTSSGWGAASAPMP